MEQPQSEDYGFSENSLIRPLYWFVEEERQRRDDMTLSENLTGWDYE